MRPSKTIIKYIKIAKNKSMKNLSIIAFGLIISLGILQSCQSSTSTSTDQTTENID
jgi:hypothetical protein